MINDQISVYCDGGSRGNPGPAASAFVAKDLTGKIIHQQGLFLGVATNNQAEYQAVIFALQWIAKQFPNPNSQTTIHFYLDSLLVVNQLNSLYKIKDHTLKQKYIEIKKIIETCGLRLVIFKQIPRSQNSLADLLVNKILDSQLH